MLSDARMPVVSQHGAGPTRSAISGCCEMDGGDGVARTALQAQGAGRGGCGEMNEADARRWVRGAARWARSAAPFAGLCSMMVLADARSMLPAVAAPGWVGALFQGLGGIAVVAVVAATRAARGSGVVLSGREADRPSSEVAWVIAVMAAALGNAVGMLLSREIPNPTDADGLLLLVLVGTGAALRGASCGALLLAWCRWLARQDGRRALALACLALGTACLAGIPAYGIGGRTLPTLLVAVATVACPLAYAACSRLREGGAPLLADMAAEPSVEDGGTGRQELAATGEARLLVVLTFLLVLLNCLFRTPLVDLNLAGLTVNATRVCTCVGSAAAAALVGIAALRRPGQVEAGSFAFYIASICVLLHCCVMLLGAYPALTVILRGMARRLAFLMLFALVISAGSHQAANRIAAACLGASSLASVAAALVTWLGATAGESAGSAVRTAALVLALLVMAWMAARRLGAPAPAAVHASGARGEGAEADSGRDGARLASDSRAEVEVFLEGKGLTARELEVAGLLAEGLPAAEIAERLSLSPATVRVHSSHIYGKCGVSAQAEFVAACHGSGRG